MYVTSVWTSYFVIGTDLTALSIILGSRQRPDVDSKIALIFAKQNRDTDRETDRLFFLHWLNHKIIKEKVPHILYTSSLNFYLTQLHVHIAIDRIPYSNVSAIYSTGAGITSGFSQRYMTRIMCTLFGRASVTVVTDVNVEVF